MSCENCIDPDGARCFPVYGLAPHKHFTDLIDGVKVLGTSFAPKDTWPENFSPDPEDDTLGTYTHCPECGE